MIGIFDSGIGGATIFKEILKLVPNYHYFYYSDSINNPYGDKSPDEIYEIVKNVVVFLIDKGCSIIVIACNTASTICVKKLREEFSSITFIATEPAYKMVFDYAIDGKTIVMATKGTIESERFNFLYHTYDNGKTFLLMCPGLADLIEQNKKNDVKVYLKNLFKDFIDIENVVLGCTHYPLIKKEIKDVLGEVRFFDSGRGVSMELKRQIEKKGLKKTKKEIEFFDSSSNSLKKERFYKIIGENILENNSTSN